MKKIIMFVLMVFVLMASVFAVSLLRPSTVYSGTATYLPGAFGFSSDTFSVVFDTPLRQEYQVNLEGFSTPVEMIWDNEHSVNYGAGLLEKDCYVIEKKPTGFKGLCNYRLYQVGMAYGFRGEYANYWGLQHDYLLEGAGNTAFKVDWMIAVQEVSRVR
jgi:hypothetical protein